MKCQDCSGRGWRITSGAWADNDGNYGGAKGPCSTCKGSGLPRLTATDVAAWLIDRAEQYDTGSDLDMELFKLARAVMTGELHESIAHGELDAPDLVRRVLGGADVTWVPRKDTIYRSISKWGGMRQAKDHTIGWRAKEVADALGLSVSTIYSLARSGKIPSLRIGRILRFPPRALKAAIKAGHHLKV